MEPRPGAPEPEEASRPERIGLFGGTFDPPHCGHVSVARDVADRLELDRVLWIPAGEPPHKPSDRPAAAALRLEMTRSTVVADPRFEASTLEVERDGPSYTVDTVRAVRAERPEAELFVIIGVDQYHELDSWRDPLGILEEARLVVIDRGGASAEAVHPRVLDGIGRAPLADLGAVSDREPLPPIVFVRVGRVDISASEIRARRRRAEDIRGMVPASVFAIVEREGLYA